MAGSDGGDDHPPPGVVELREDVPLKSGGGDPRRCAGPRLIAGAFAALTAAITLALLTQIYYGDYEVVPHGAVATSRAACSRAGAALLRAGGSALDAAAAAALCLALPPKATPAPPALHASGSMLYWEYRRSHGSPPTLAEWGGGGGGGVPALVGALARLHALYGRLPWARVLQPAVDYANGTEDGAEVNSAMVEVLRGFQHNTSIELSAAWEGGGGALALGVAGVAVGEGEGLEEGWRAAAPAAALPALRLALRQDVPGALASLAEGSEGAEGEGEAEGAWGVAVADPQDTYVALVAGAGAVPVLAWGGGVCGARWALAGGAAAAAQVAARAAAGEAPAPAVEAARAPGPGAAAAVLAVRQLADALLSHADSRANGLAIRF